MCLCVCVCLSVCVCVCLHFDSSAGRLRIKNQPLPQATLLFVAIGINGARVSLL